MMRWWVLLCLSIAMLVAGVASAQDDDFTNSDPKVVVTKGILKDPEFRVESRKLGFRRDVEMLQWTREEGEYVMRWRDARIPDESFDADHRNPPMPLLRSAIWLSDDATIDGKPVDPAVLMSLGQWIRMRPSFSKVPYRWSLRFEPDGDGMSNSDNPLEPAIGDVRITWSEMFVPTLERQVVFANGMWQLTDSLSIDYATREQLLRQSHQDEARITLNNFLFRFWSWAAMTLFATLLIARIYLNYKKARD